MGLATAAWMEPYWGGAYYHPAYWGGYPCCGVGERQRVRPLGQHDVLRHAHAGTRGGGVAGTTASGSYYNSRTGTSGTYNAGRQYNAYTGNASRGYDRTANTRGRRLRPTSRARSNYNTYTRPALDRLERVRRPAPAAARYQRTGATTAGPEGYAHAGEGSTYNAKTGKTNTWGTGERRQQPLRRRQRQRLHEHRQRLAAALVERLGRRLGRHVVGRPGIAGAQSGGGSFGASSADRFGGGGWGGDRLVRRRWRRRLGRPLRRRRRLRRRRFPRRRPALIDRRARAPFGA